MGRNGRTIPNRHHPFNVQLSSNLSLELLVRRTLLIIKHHILQVLENRFADEIVALSRWAVVGGAGFEGEDVGCAVLRD
jgi:hypothetical protein